VIAVVTIAGGRHAHLSLQLAALRAVGGPWHVVVAMDDPELAALCGDAAHVVGIGRGPDGALPLAAARNLGAATAIAAGADLLVFLDVDCVPGPALLARFGMVAYAHPGALLSGPVSYLPPPPRGGYRLAALPRLAEPHPARPNPRPDRTVRLDHDLFWSLSFAVTKEVWARVGGFDEGYTGYGAEDTDFAQRARAAGVPHLFVGGAHAYHQWHPTAEPPRQHVADILRNGRRFRERWGRWPMTGWLLEFERLGLVIHDRAADDWRLA